MNELEELLYGESETAEEFLVREEQVNRQGRVNLDQNRIFRVADEGLYAQILFDFLEEELDLTPMESSLGMVLSKRRLVCSWRQSLVCVQVI